MNAMPAKTRPDIRFLALAGAAAMASCAPMPAPTRVPVSTARRGEGSVDSRLFQEVNAYRRSHGAKELQRHAGLDHLARQHSEYLRQHRGSFTISGKNVSHIGFDGRYVAARERFQMYNVSENVAAAYHAGTNPVPLLLGLWIASKDHHANMINAWTHTGVGVVIDTDGTAFATEIFATQYLSQTATRRRFNQF